MPDSEEEPNDGEGDYSIGSEHWPGLSKLIEECGEVLQVAGKIMGTGGNPHHWDGTNLTDHCFEEPSRGADRTNEKLALFRQWHGESRA